MDPLTLPPGSNRNSGLPKPRQTFALSRALNALLFAPWSARIFAKSDTRCRVAKRTRDTCRLETRSKARSTRRNMSLDK